MPHIVITAVGPDRPGLVGELTSHLHAGGGNIADSRMVNLRGQFALILLVEGSEPTLAVIRQAVGPAGRKLGLTVTVAQQQVSPSGALAGVPFKLKTYSLDQPGIVHQISQVLYQHGINIEELQTRLTSAPFAGTPLFTMEMLLTVPTNVSVRQLRAQLQTLGDALNCDVDLEPA